MVATHSCTIRNLLMVELEARNFVLDRGGQACSTPSPDGGREGLWQLGMNNTVLAPLVFLHRLLPEELLVTDVALERTVVAVGTLVDLTQNNSFIFLCTELIGTRIFKYFKITIVGPIHETKI